MASTVTQLRLPGLAAALDSAARRDAATTLPDAAAQLQIGRVVAVSGSQIVALITEGVGQSTRVDANSIQMGALVKIPTATSIVFGVVSSLSIPMPTRNGNDEELEMLQLDLLGECDPVTDVQPAKFRRGISNFPTLGDRVLGTTQEDLQIVYARPAETTVQIGTIHQDLTIPARIVVNDLLGKHLAILGSTGSGKSCAAALILRSILKHHPNAHVLLLDPHNEYAHAFRDMAEVIDAGNLQLPYWLLNFQELAEVLGQAGAKLGPSEAAILNEIIANAKRQFIGNSAESRYVTADTPTPYRLMSVVQSIDEALGRLEKPDTLAPYQQLKAAIAMLSSDARFAFMFGNLVTLRDNMAAILSRILRLPVAGKPITILDLSAIPSEIINVVVSVLCRMTFDFALWSEGAIPILLVCEEAHRYAPEDSRLGFEPTKRSLSRIAKEGRKYGLSLCVISQRPSELAAGMLSQCSTIFALRLSHQNDQDLVRGAMSESAFGLLDALPSLGNAEAIVVGEGVAVPMRLAFDELPPERRPKSGTASFSESWQNEIDDTHQFVQEIVDRWRRQRR